MQSDVTVKFLADKSGFIKELRGVQKDTDGATKQIQGSFTGASNRIKGATQGVTSTLKKVAGVVAGVFAVGKVIDFGKSITEASQQTQSMNAQFNTVFKDKNIPNMAKEAQASLNKVASSTHINANRMKGSYSSIAAFAKNSGMQTKEANTFTAKAMRVAADSSSFYDKSLEETTDTLKSFLKGNYENDDALGISSTETTRNAVANKMFGKSFDDLSEKQKQSALLQQVLNGQLKSGAIGQAAREGSSLENVMGNLNQAWTDFKAKIGGPLLAPVVSGINSMIQAINKIPQDKVTAFIQKLVNGAEKVGTKIAEVIPKIINFINKLPKEEIKKTIQDIIDKVSSLIKFISDLIPKLIKIAPTVLPIIASIASVVATITTIVTAVNKVKKAVATLKMAGEGIKTTFTALSALSGMGIFGVVIIGIVAVIAGLVTLWNTSEGFRNFVKGVIKTISEWFAKVKVDSAKNMEEVRKNWQKIGDNINKVITKVSNAFKSWKKGIKENLDEVKQNWKNLLNSLTNAWNKTGGAFITSVKNKFNSIKTNSKKNMDSVKTNWSNAISSMKSFWAKAGPALSKSFSSIMSAIKGYITKRITEAKNRWSSILNAIKSVALVVWGGIKAYISAVMATIKGIISVATKLIKGDWSGAWDEIKGYFTKIWNNIVDTFSNINLYDIAKNIIAGLVNGLKDAAGAVWDVVTDVGRSITDSFKSFFNIHSPSRLMDRDIGQYITLGLAQGIAKQTSKAVKAVRNVNKAVFGAFNATPALALNSAIDTSSVKGLSFGNATIGAKLDGTADLQSKIERTDTLSVNVYIDGELDGNQIYKSVKVRQQREDRYKKN